MDRAKSSNNIEKGYEDVEEGGGGGGGLKFCVCAHAGGFKKSAGSRGKRKSWL